MAEEHKHFQCEKCETVFCEEDPRYETMQAGDSCPRCHVATVAEIEVASSAPPELIEHMRNFKNIGDEIATTNVAMIKLRERQVAALERIAEQLEAAGEWAAAITHVDDRGQKTIRVTGEFVGGDGDVTVDG